MSGSTEAAKAGGDSLPKAKGRGGLGAELQLLLVALIWGLDFVAQRQGVLGMGPFSFNAASFALGAAFLGARIAFARGRRVPGPSARRSGILLGVVLFGALSLQSSGMASTGAGKAAFITSLYVALVPLGGRLFGQRIGMHVWIGCALSLAGLWFLCVRQDLTLASGDLLVLACAFFWAAHILLVGRFASRVDEMGLAFWQFLTCAVLSLVPALLLEDAGLASLRASVIPILYNGLLSAGVAYALQISGQGGAPASRAALILSLETVFAGAGGWLLLGEDFGLRELFGSALMLSGVVASRLGGGPSGR